MAMITRPLCRMCSKPWAPPPGMTASQGYCRRCRKQRRTIAKRVLSLGPVTPNDLDGPYLRPRIARKPLRP
jgi:hypothetical protein